MNFKVRTIIHLLMRSGGLLQQWKSERCYQQVRTPFLRDSITCLSNLLSSAFADDPLHRSGNHVRLLIQFDYPTYSYVFKAFVNNTPHAVTTTPVIKHCFFSCHYNCYSSYVPQEFGFSSLRHSTTLRIVFGIITTTLR